MTATLRSEKVEAEPRIRELGLNPDLLMEIVREAVGAANESTPNDPLTAPGTFSYIYGTRALRERFCGDEWETDRRNAVEAIFNPERRVRVIFQNVDWAADQLREPKPRSRKGIGSERACIGNQLHFDLPEPPPPDTYSEVNVTTLYLMVSHEGEDVRAEVSRPVVKDGKFEAFLERNFLIRAGEWNAINVAPGQDDQGDDDIAIEVIRKK